MQRSVECTDGPASAIALVFAAVATCGPSGEEFLDGVGTDCV